MSRFVTGSVYEVGPSLGNYLLADGAAVPVTDEVPALVIRTHDKAAPPPHVRSEAEDRSGSRKEKRPRKRR